MCGIIGYVGSDEVVPVILDGLRRLEYRGYDSAGMAVMGGGDGIQVLRAAGKLRNLEQLAYHNPLHGNLGVGHVRYPTVGGNSNEDAQPFHHTFPLGTAMTTCVFVIASHGVNFASTPSMNVTSQV